MPKTLNFLNNRVPSKRGKNSGLTQNSGGNTRILSSDLLSCFSSELSSGRLNLGPNAEQEPDFLVPIINSVPWTRAGLKALHGVYVGITSFLFLRPIGAHMPSSNQMFFSDREEARAFEQKPCVPSASGVFQRAIKHPVFLCYDYL